jgi:hypothetical protein
MKPIAVLLEVIRQEMAAGGKSLPASDQTYLD